MPLGGTHSVHGAAVFETRIQTYGRYFYIFEGPTEPGACYASRHHRDQPALPIDGLMLAGSYLRRTGRGELVKRAMVDIGFTYAP